MIIRAVIIPSPKPIMKCVVTMANKTVPTGIDIVPPIAYWIVKAIDENTTLKIPASTLTVTIEVLFFPMNFIQYLTINQLVALVTMAIFKTFTPNALRPPSAKRRD